MGNATWWLSSAKMTVGATVDEGGIVVDGPPIVRRFVGQRLERLVGWMRKQGGLRIERLGVLARTREEY